MKIIAVSNIKGGVGKTTTAVNLAYLSAAGGHVTVLWDLDPQGAATYTLRCEAGESASAKKLVAGKRELPELLVETGYPRLDLIPAHFSYRNFDVHLSNKKRPTERLLMMSTALRQKYDVLLLDCPPGISLLSENVLRAADAVIVPILPTPLSVRMLRQLNEFIAGEGWSDMAVLPFFSMVDRRKALHHTVIESVRAEVPSVLATEIRYASEIERMTVRRAPLPAYAPNSAEGQLYSALWNEIAARVELASSPGVQHQPVQSHEEIASCQAQTSPEKSLDNTAPSASISY
ncbi:MAG TPA: ParA family protein [Steroidobacteraceae bacterium]|nr:ParA family protein [Steroidobacteraceae bacterium]